MKKSLEHYRAYLNMYGSMMVDLAKSENYLKQLRDKEGLTEFELAVRKKIEKSPRF